VPSATTKWESKLWFRLKRLGPKQLPADGGPALYETWRAKMMLKGINFYTGANPSFTWGYMDSVEIGTTANNALKYEFCSQFRDGPSSGGGNLPADVCFNWNGGGEQAEGNEILPDGVFTPGTKVEYFITTNYICTPTGFYYYPDTTGKAYSEFEILPSYRNEGGEPKFPCVLYVDSFNRGSQLWIENSLNVALNDLPSLSPVPDPTRWDRFDYMDASSNWNGPLYRAYQGNSGATIFQLRGYKLILVSTGTFGAGCMEPRDWLGFKNWLDFPSNGGNTTQQGFIADGSGISDILNTDNPAFLTQTLAATHRCRTYNEVNCPPGEGANNDEQNCVRLDPVPGSPFCTGIPTDVFNNWCPVKISYGVLGALASAGGVGNKTYTKIGPGYVTNYAQVIHDAAATQKYRTVIDDFSYHLLKARDMANQGLAECTYTSGHVDTLARIDASYRELKNSVRWALDLMGGADPCNTSLGTAIGYCVNPITDILQPNSDVPEVEGALTTRLYQNHPNPFNPRTVIKFSLAADGPAKLIIYDVNGRRIRTLVDNALKAGMHEVVWDGTDDSGHTVTSGVYWSQMQADSYSSNKKMVVLK
jgi:hypothetical protein